MSKNHKIERLYRVVDVRRLKTQIWNRIKNTKITEMIENNLIKNKKNKNMIEKNDKKLGNVGDFKTLCDSVQKEEKGTKVSASTCFVCLLHLCNEKGNID